MTTIERPASTRPDDPQGRGRPSPGSVASARFNPPIQGLRAVAVLGVMLYHLWPDRISGGYVGVDVFFVISGFLITQHLVRELDHHGRIRLAEFWARRIRRLLPAAFVVLAASLLFVLIALPQVGWGQQLREIRSAGAYFENWQLVSDAIDYLGAGNSPSLVQHFWSLSVEEQFYVVEPLLLVGAFALSRSKRVITIVLCGVVLLSGVYSVVLTGNHDAAAYFSTGTRACEFAAGGLTAVLLAERRVRRFAAVIAGGIGLSLVVATMVLYTPATPFPGWASFVPVVGSVLILVACSSSGTSPVSLLAVKPLTAVGDISYSLYLWHWPLIVAVPMVLGRPMGFKIKIAVLIAAFLLAWLTKRLVEDRWRRPRDAGRRTLRRTYIGMLAGVAILATVTTVSGQLSAATADQQASQVRREIASGPTTCLGAAAVINDCSRPYAVTSTVQPAVAADDVPWNRGVAASMQCPGQSNVDAPRAHACTFGDTSASTTWVLIGDSHADHLIDPLHLYAKQHGIRLVTYTREGCSGIPAARPTDAACEAWSEQVEKAVRARKDVGSVLYSNNTVRTTPTGEDASAAFSAMMATGKRVVPIVDVPGSEGSKVPQCVAAHLGQYDPCTTAEPAPSFMSSVADELRIRSVTLDDVLCRGGRCHSVIGGLIVYMDDNHMTLQFAQTLYDVLGSRIAGAIRDEG